MFFFTFSSCFLHDALSSRNTKDIDLCRFLINDISHVLQQPIDFKVNRQFYRGLKLTNEDLEKLIKHTEKLICPKGFFIRTKSRKLALNLAQSPNYRLDLRPVLFKINCPLSIHIGEVPMIGTSGLVVFDVYMAFRINYVNRDSVSVVNLEPADEVGRNLARAYRMKYKSENVQTLLDQLSTLPKYPARLSPIQRSPSLPSANVTPKVIPKKVG
jgi:hypothetical protein